MKLLVFITIFATKISNFLHSALILFIFLYYRAILKQVFLMENKNAPTETGDMFYHSTMMAKIF
ncbi:MAG: hypothetical protein J1F27_06805, partial [Prevotellaceae bacterium]|nr:hypothetical protein [Prevotellaceae bacterium]